MTLNEGWSLLQGEPVPASLKWGLFLDFLIHSNSGILKVAVEKKFSSDKGYLSERRLVNERCEKWVARIVRSNKRAKTQWTRAEINGGASQSISRRTTRRNLQSIRFSRMRPSKVSLKWENTPVAGRRNRSLEKRKK